MGLKKVEFNEQDFKKIFQPVTPATKAVRLLKRGVQHLIGLALLFGIFFIVLNSGAFWLRFNYAIKAQPTNQIVQPEPVKPVPIEEATVYTPEVIIPKIGVQAPLLMSVQPSQMTEQLRSGVVHYADSALPGQIGNAVILGHSSDYPWSPGKYKNVFALLDKLTPGDTITIPYRSQQYVYEVIESKVVKPSELSVLKKTDQPRLTIISCYPVGTAQKRLIVTARLIQGQPMGIQVNEPLIDELPQTR